MRITVFENNAKMSHLIFSILCIEHIGNTSLAMLQNETFWVIFKHSELSNYDCVWKYANSEALGLFWEIQWRGAEKEDFLT